MSILFAGDLGEDIEFLVGHLWDSGVPEDDKEVLIKLYIVL